LAASISEWHLLQNLVARLVIAADGFDLGRIDHAVQAIRLTYQEQRLRFQIDHVIAE